MKSNTSGKQPSIKEAFSKAKYTPSTSKKPNQDESVVTAKYVPNLVGENIDTFTSETKHKKFKNLVDLREPPAIHKENESKILVKQQTPKSYTARFRIHIYDTSVNVGLILNQIIQLWRVADPSMILHEFNDEKNSTTMIDHENKLSENEEEIKNIWQESVRIKENCILQQNFQENVK